MSTLLDSPVSAPSKPAHIGLWVAQLLLAAPFLMAGAMKTFSGLPALEAAMPWVHDLPHLVRFIGVSELAGGIGLVVPAATRIKPFLTPLAAIGLLTIMVLAALFHMSRGEFSAVPVNAALGALAALVAWGRFVKAPIAAR